MQRTHICHVLVACLLLQMPFMAFGEDVITKYEQQICSQMDDPEDGDRRMSNWGGNFDFSSSKVYVPKNVTNLQQIVRNAYKARVVGSQHSFSQIADSGCSLISTLQLNRILRFDTSVPSVTVEGGIYYKDMIEELNNRNFALSNLAALSSVTVAGAIQTGTHGSGINNPGLASQVRSLELVKADGEVVQIGRNDPRLKAIAVGLGAFGVITKVELQLVPAYNLQQFIYQNMPINSFLNNFYKIWPLGYSVQMINQFTTPGVWGNLIINVHSDAAIPSELDNDLFGATLVANNTLSWNNGLMINNFGLETTFAGDHIQTEYFVPYKHAVKAIHDVLPFFKESHANFAQYNATLIGMLVRAVRADDDHWMSEYKRHAGDAQPISVAIHFSWHNRWPLISSVLLPPIENALLKYGAVPHWGKEFTMRPSEFIGHYTKRADFIKLVQEFDPTEKFRNNFMERNIFCTAEKCLKYAPPKVAMHVTLERVVSESRNHIKRWMSHIGTKLSDIHTYKMVIQNMDKAWAACSPIQIKVTIHAKQEIREHPALVPVSSTAAVTSSTKRSPSVDSAAPMEFVYKFSSSGKIAPGTAEEAGLTIVGTGKMPLVSLISARACLASIN